MRKLIYGINLTIDGCCDHTKGIADEEIHEYFTQLMRDADTIVYGRKTYELMVPFWPDVARTHSGPTNAMNDFAQAFCAIKNIVVCSRTLYKLDGKNTSIINGNLEEEILKLKQLPGGNISTGGVDIPSQLIALGLVDEFHIVIHPVVAGEGRRLMDDTKLSGNLRSKLTDTKIFKSGAVALRYAKE